MKTLTKNPNTSRRQITNLSPEIIFEDAHLLILSKPAGLLSQGEKKGDPNLVDWLRTYLARPYVGLIHRLDRNTSGIMIVAKRSKAANRLTAALQTGKIQRTYLAWLEGELSEAFLWEHFLYKDEKINLAKVVGASHPYAKSAALSGLPIGKGAWMGTPLTLVELKLETGRSHQIRAQASAEGHPVLGDVKYSNHSVPGLNRPALHSYRISFPHPMTDKIMSFEAPLPEDLKRIPLSKRIP